MSWTGGVQAFHCQALNQWSQWKMQRDTTHKAHKGPQGRKSDGDTSRMMIPMATKGKRHGQRVTGGNARLYRARQAAHVQSAARLAVVMGAAKPTAGAGTNAFCHCGLHDGHVPCVCLFGLRRLGVDVLHVPPCAAGPYYGSASERALARG